MGEGDNHTGFGEDDAEPGRMEPATAGADGIAAAERFIAALHKALRRFGSYPPANPLCVGAAAECHRAFRSATAAGALRLDVGQDEILQAGQPLLPDEPVSTELARLLHRLNIGSVLFESHASARELAGLCRQLAELELQKDRPIGGPAPHLPDCPHIQLQPLRRLKVLDACDLSGARLSLAAHYGRSGGGRDGAETSAGAYLYPVGRAWVLVDSASDISRISMVDLAFVLDDPAAFAEVLEQLSQEDAGAAVTRGVAFERNFPEIAGLFSVLDGSLRDRMLARLASALLQLSPERRRRLLTDRLIPSLIEGRSEAAVLRYLPDRELAGALALSLGGRRTTETLGLAIERLEVSPDRTNRLFDLILRDVGQHGTNDADDPAPGRIRGLDGGSIRLERDASRDLRGFDSYDLSLDVGTEARLRAVRTSLEVLDGHSERLRCLGNVLWTAPSASAARDLLEQVFTIFDELGRSRRWLDVAQWTLHFMDMAERDRELAPDVKEALREGLAGMVSVGLFVGLLRNAANGDDESRAALETVVATLPATATGLLIELLGQRIDVPSVIDVMSRNVNSLAESIRAHLNHDDPFVVRCLLRVLGSADPGYEMLVAAKMRHPNSMVAREAYRALARMRTPKAVALVGDRLRKGDPLERRLAAATLVKFKKKMADQIALGVLGQDSFVRGDPTLASLLLKTVQRRSIPQLPAVVDRLARFRFHFWRPELARLGRQARALRAE